MKAAHITPTRLCDVPATRWKNGKGITRELLRVAAHGNPDDFALRISIANMDCDAGFSTYPGIDRILAILRGSGMELIDVPTGAVCHALRGRYSSVAFAGERQLEGRLPDGPILDFNVMVRRDMATAAVRIVEPSRTVPALNCRLLFVAQGQARITFEDGSALVLEESGFIEPMGAEYITTADASVAFLVDFCWREELVACNTAFVR